MRRRPPFPVGRATLIGIVIGACGASASAVALLPAQQSPTPAAEKSPGAVDAPLAPLFELELGDWKFAPRAWPGLRFWAEGRWRSEHWSHFETPAGEGDYDFSHLRLRQGLSQEYGRAVFGLEWQAAHLFGVDRSAPSGPGKNYRDANGSGSPQSLSWRQLWIDFDAEGTFVRAGRQLYEDNGGVKADDPAFQYVRDRGNARLVGNLDWTASGRMFDGLALRREGAEWLVRAVAFEANEGAFDVDDTGDSLEEVQVGGLELVAKRGALHDSTEARGFAYAFRDDRAVTNARFGDELAVTTIGGQLASRFAAGAGAVDLFLWGALQRGDAGSRAQRSGAWIAETGYRFESAAMKPWLRLGHARGGGDASTADGQVGDFYNGLPTNHTYHGYADLFALTNLRNSYVDLILDPHPQIRFVATFHAFATNNGDARAFAGSGPFSTPSYGYATTTTTSRNLGKEVDLTLRATTASKRVHALLGWSSFRGATAYERLFDREDVSFGYAEIGFRL